MSLEYVTSFPSSLQCFKTGFYICDRIYQRKILPFLACPLVMSLSVSVFKISYNKV